MAKTENGFRYYICKKCATETKEPLRNWKKKPQKDKNVCQKCLDRRRIAEQTRREMLDDAAFYARYTWPF